MEAKKEGKALDVNELEGTTLGVHQIQYDVAITYPKCLKSREFCRYMWAPTMCYQLVYPLNPKRDWI